TSPLPRGVAREAGHWNTAIDDQFEVLPDRGHLRPRADVAAPHTDGGHPRTIDHQRRHAVLQRLSVPAVGEEPAVGVPELEARVGRGRQSGPRGARPRRLFGPSRTAGFPGPPDKQSTNPVLSNATIPATTLVWARSGRT